MYRRSLWFVTLVLSCLVCLPIAASAQTAACIYEEAFPGVDACADGFTEAECSGPNLDWESGTTCASRAAEYGAWDGACTGIEDEGAPDCVLLSGSEAFPASTACASEGGEWAAGATCAAAVPALPSSGQGALLAVMLLVGLGILTFRSRRSTA